MFFFACGSSNEPVEDNTTNEVVNIETGPECVTVSIENGSGVFNELLYGNCSSSDDTEWGPNNAYTPGEPISFEVEPGEYYDLRCVDSADNEYFIWDVPIEADGFRWLVELSDKDNSFTDNPSVSHNSKGEAAITIYINPGCGVITHIYCDRLDAQSPMDAVDRLGTDLLYPNEEFTFHVPVCYSYRYLLWLESTYGDDFLFYGISIDEDGIYLDLTKDDSTRL